MRLLLDAQLSGSRVGRLLRDAGHDIRALSDEPDAEGLEDEQVLELGASERRVLITLDVADFPRLLRDWAESGRAHAGVVIVYGVQPNAFKVIADGVLGLMREYPRQAEWTDLVLAIGRRTR